MVGFRCKAETHKSTLCGDQSLPWQYVALWRWSLFSSIIYLKNTVPQLIWSWRISEKQIHILYSQLDQQLCNSKFPWHVGFDLPGLSLGSGTRRFLYLISSLANVSTRLAVILEEMLALYFRKSIWTKFSVLWLIQKIRSGSVCCQKSLILQKKTNPPPQPFWIMRGGS